MIKKYRHFTFRFKIVILAVIFSFAFNGQVNAFDVTSDQDKDFIKVTKFFNETGDTVGFEYCEFDTGQCRQLGSQKAYRYKDLVAQRYKYYGDSLSAVALDVLVFGTSATVIVGGGMIAGMAGGAGLAVGKVLTLPAVFLTASGTISVWTAYAVDRLNPIRLYQKAQKLDGDVIQDRLVKIGGSIKVFATELDLVLKEIR